jgi:Amt family ammonium transporter
METLFTEILSLSYISGVLSEMGANGLTEVQEALSVTHDEAAASLNAMFTANNIWMMLATALVFIMHLGFASVEAGFTQTKNTVNILYKNTLTLAIGLVSYTIIGFSLMYPGEFSLGSWLGWSGFGLSLPENGLTPDYADAGYTYWTDFLFQGMFAATAATIVSGAVAERIKISGYLLFTLFYVGLVYPIAGSWKWGGGFLEEMGFYDFAGSSLVHSVGGWAALVGIWILGPRLGKYGNGKVNDFPGSSVPLATIGVFLLWLGWFGFNGGSVLSAEPGATSLVIVTTSLAAAAGAIGGTIGGYIMFKRLDFGMVLNGILAGLVGITAGADQMGPGAALLIGLIAGIIVVFSAVILDKFKLDDCVGAVSVHLVCGIFGTLAVGIFGEMAGLGQFWIQLKGVAVYAVVSFGSAYLIFKTLDMIMGLRVSPEHEKSGMDSHEHGIRGYTITYDE